MTIDPEFRALGFNVKRKDITTVEHALLSNIQQELERIGKYLNVLCQILAKEQQCSEK